MLGYSVMYFRAVEFSSERTIANTTLVSYLNDNNRNLWFNPSWYLKFKISRLLTFYYIWYRAFKKYSTLLLIFS